MQWARLGAGSVVVATAERAWHHRSGSPHDPFARPMTGAGDRASTGHLLDAAIAVGMRAGADGPPVPPLTHTRWVWRLVGYYHLTHHTPGLLRAAATRFEAAGRPALAAWAEDKAREETAHDRLALKDLDELGYAPGIVTLEPPVARAMVERFRESVAAPLPLGVIAYAHVVERLALLQDEAAIAAVRAVLPPRSRAIRCLKVHSATGSDPAHVAENIELVSGLPAAERALVALACFRVAAIFCNRPSGGFADDAELERRFLHWRRAEEAG